MNASFFLVINHNLEVLEMERPRFGPTHTAAEIWRLLKLTRSHPPVMHRTGELTLVWRDPHDWHFDPMNAAAWHVAGRMARGNVVVMGPEPLLRRFRLADYTTVHAPMPPRLQLT